MKGLREEAQILREQARGVVEQVNRVILGKEREVEEVLLAFLSGGHVLLEDIPGTGKTTLALAFSRAMDLECRRVQFTPDVMPSDLTGFSVYRREEGRFVYQPGSVFCNLLLADEINRTSPKTQSALLEVMEERKVSVEGVTRAVPRPFHVIATQNPAGSAGTSLLPEAQVDRFMVSLSLGYPDFAHELEMAMEAGEGSRADVVRPVMGREALMEMQRAAETVYLHETVARYILELVTATRVHPYLSQGASPRATIALARLSKSAAWYQGRDYVTPGDVYEQFPFAAAHRIVRNTAAKLENRSAVDILREIAAGVRRPRMGRIAP